MKNLKRYMFYSNEAEFGCSCEMVEMDNGAYVKFSDVEVALRSASDNGQSESLLCEPEKCCHSYHVNGKYFQSAYCSQYCSRSSKLGDQFKPKE